MAWCEANKVDYLFGLAKNKRLIAEIEPELAEATEESRRTGKAARRFKDFMWCTLDSWSRRRRVIGKAEVTQGDTNPRFVVTSFKASEAKARHLYEKVYCARGEMENRIRECQADLFADRTSSATIRLKLLKIGARVTVSVRRIKIAMASAYPWRDAWELAHHYLRSAATR